MLDLSFILLLNAIGDEPNGTSLKLQGSTRNDSGREGSFLAALLQGLRDRGE